MLGLQVCAKDLLHILPDAKTAKCLEVGQAVEEQDPLGEPVGMLHFVDRLVPLIFSELLDAPIVEHPVVQPILIDRGQLFLERLVQQLDDLGIALHPALRVARRGCAVSSWWSSQAARESTASRLARSSSIISRA